MVHGNKNYWFISLEDIALVHEAQWLMETESLKKAFAIRDKGSMDETSTNKGYDGPT